MRIEGINSNPVDVNDEHRLLAESIIVSEEHHVNKHEKEAYTWQFSEDPDAADDCIFYIKNLSEENLNIEGMDIYITDDCEVYLKVGGTGTIATGTAITGTNLNAGSGNAADVTCIHDGDIEAGGTFSGGMESNRYKFTTGTTVDTHHINFPMDIIIPKNQVFSLWCDTIAIVIVGTLYGYFHK
jgi:hypothetical protein